MRLVRRNLDETFPFCYIIRILQHRRDDLAAHLKALGIMTGVHYIPNHLQPLFREQQQPLPQTEQVFDEIITLPLYYEMSDREVEHVASGVRAFFGLAKWAIA